MNQKFKTLILWALPILLVIALSYQFLSSSNVDSLKSNGTTVHQEIQRLQELVTADF